MHKLNSTFIIRHDVTWDGTETVSVRVDGLDDTAAPLTIGPVSSHDISGIMALRSTLRLLEALRQETDVNANVRTALEKARKTNHDARASAAASSAISSLIQAVFSGLSDNRHKKRA